MVGMSANALFTYKQGVDISPNQRGRIMKTYSPEHRVSAMERWATLMGGVNVEGSGIDHEKWQQEKDAYMKK